MDFESGPTSLSSLSTSSTPTTTAVSTSLASTVPSSNNMGGVTPTPTATVSDVKSKYNIDVVANNPLKWTVTQVCDFVKNLPGCSDYIDDFQLQEIDGQALMLLKADHLMSAMAIKLGPALKICRAIEEMRGELNKNWRRAHRKRVLFKLGSKLVGEVDVIEEQNNNAPTTTPNAGQIADEKSGESSANSSGNDSILSRASVYDELFNENDNDHEAEADKDDWLIQNDQKRVCEQWATKEICKGEKKRKNHADYVHKCMHYIIYVYHGAG